MPYRKATVKRYFSYIGKVRSYPYASAAAGMSRIFLVVYPFRAVQADDVGSAFPVFVATMPCVLVPAFPFPVCLFLIFLAPGGQSRGALFPDANDLAPRATLRFFAAPRSAGAAAPRDRAFV